MPPFLEVFLILWLSENSLLVLTHICANRFRMDQHNLQNVIINEKYLIFYDSDGMENS